MGIRDFGKIVSKLLIYCTVVTGLIRIINVENHKPRFTNGAPTFGRNKLQMPTNSSSVETRYRIKSILPVSRKMNFGEFIWNDLGVSSAQVWVMIDVHHQIISVFRAGREIGTAVVIFGADGYPTPFGQFSILERHAHHKSNLYDAEMPFMLRLTNDGVAIHASDVRKGAATHGCIGVPKRFAQLLFNVTRIGNMVVIRSGKP